MAGMRRYKIFDKRNFTENILPSAINRNRARTVYARLRAPTAPIRPQKGVIIWNAATLTHAPIRVAFSILLVCFSAIKIVSMKLEKAFIDTPVKERGIIKRASRYEGSMKYGNISFENNMNIAQPDIITLKTYSTLFSYLLNRLSSEAIR